MAFVIPTWYLVDEMSTESAKAGAASSTAESLVLDHLEPDLDIARRLPPSLAFRYGVLPLAETEQHLTVAMVDPNDTQALRAVTGALGTELCIVQGDAMAIDRALSRIWRDMGRRDVHILVSVSPNCLGNGVKPYVEYVAELLDADVDYCPDGSTLDGFVEQATDDYELMICGTCGGGSDGRYWLETGRDWAADHLSIPLLVAHRPRQPLRRVLLIVQGSSSDHRAADWALRLAGSSGAAVTALAIVPPASTAGRLSRLEGGLAELLSADEVLGRRMRHIAQRLVDGDIRCTLRLRQGPPAREIRREAVGRVYDLVVVGVAGQGTARFPYSDESLVPLLRLLDRPTLIAR